MLNIRPAPRKKLETDKQKTEKGDKKIQKPVEVKAKNREAESSEAESPKSCKTEIYTRLAKLRAKSPICLSMNSRRSIA